VISLTAVVVGLNEGKMLKRCLASLSFCKEVIYLDLGSSDKSIHIAQGFPNVHARIINRVPAVEKIHSELKNYTQSEWVLIIDPDESIDPVLQAQLTEKLETLDQLSDVGAIEVPEVYYFKNKQLRGGIWGGIKYRTLIVNQQRFTFTNSVHSGRHLKPGYVAERLGHFGDNIIHHFWSSSYLRLFLKHKRYLKLEGPVRFSNGQRIEKIELQGVPVNEFKAAYFGLGGKNDGVRGLLLAAFWGWYQWEASKALYREQLKSKSE
jgi:glycosyltransferase involved in cell wall biosynthesis